MRLKKMAALPTICFLLLILITVLPVKAAEPSISCSLSEVTLEIGEEKLIPVTFSGWQEEPTIAASANNTCVLVTVKKISEAFYVDVNTVSVGSSVITVSATGKDTDGNVKTAEATINVMVTDTVPSISTDKTNLTIAPQDVSILTVKTKNYKTDPTIVASPPSNSVFDAYVNGLSITVVAKEEGTSSLTLVATGGTKSDGSTAPTLTAEVKITVKEKETDPEKPQAKSIGGASLILDVEEYIYDGREHRPGVTVMLVGKELKANIDYELTYKNNVEIGTAIAQITGIGDYTGEQSASFAIKPERVKGLKAKNIKGAKAKLSWKEVYGTEGYQLRYKVTGGSWKTINVSSTARTIAVKKGAKVTFRIRAVKGIVIGDWSESKSFKTDKK